MKLRHVNEPDRMGWRWAFWPAFLVGVSLGMAAETNTPAAAVAAPMASEQMFEGGTNAYNNWIEFGVGGFFTTGNKSQFQQRNQITGGAFGGIEDLHIQQQIAKGTTMTLDGRGIFDEHDYKL